MDQYCSSRGVPRDPSTCPGDIRKVALQRGTFVAHRGGNPPRSRTRTALPATIAGVTEDNRKAPRIGFVSLGCPKNLVDSEVMLGTLTRQGYTITSNKEEADVLVVNTCGFIDTAKQESIDTILEMAELKNSGNCKKLVVAGCLAERYRADIRKEIPEIDFVFGPDELGKILEAVRLDDSAAIPDLSIDALYTSKEVPTIPRVLTTPS